MTRRHLTPIVAVLLTALLVACGGGNDDASPTPTPLATTASSQETPSPANAPNATSTSAPDASATSASTPPATGTSSGSPTVSSTPDAGATPTVTSTPSSYTPEQAALVKVLLTSQDLPGVWALLSQTAPDTSDQPGLCGAEPFNDASTRIAEVETQYQSSDNTSFVVQNLVEYPEGVAGDALEAIRDSVTCEEFTDSSGLVVSVEETVAPEVGDESFAVHVSFQASDAGLLEGDFVYVRVGEMLTTISHLTFGEYDRNAVDDVVAAAVEKMESAGGSVGFTPQEQAVIATLLTESDLPSEWRALSLPGVSDPDAWRPLCGVSLFRNRDESLARVSVSFAEGTGPEDATLQQIITAYPNDVIDDAIQFEQASGTCDEWESGGSTITLSPAELPPVGDTMFVTRFSFEDRDGATVDGLWIAVRVDTLLLNLIYTDPQGLDTDFAEQLAADAVDKMEGVRVP